MLYYYTYYYNNISIYYIYFTCIMCCGDGGVVCGAAGEEQKKKKSKGSIYMLWRECRNFSDTLAHKKVRGHNPPPPSRRYGPGVFEL